MGRNLRAEMELRFSGLLWVGLVAILGVSTPSGEEAHLGPIDEAVSLISLDNQQADAGPEEAKAPDYGDDSPKNDGADAYNTIPNLALVPGQMQQTFEMSIVQLPCTDCS